MASFAEPDSLLKGLEKLATVPPFSTEKSLNYKVKGLAIESVVTASSTFEAATKFASWASKVRILQLKPKETTNVEVLDSYNDRYVYDIYLHDNKPLVELSYLLKASPSLNTDTINDAVNVSGRAGEVNVSNIAVDLDTGELIENTLTHFFGFSSFRPLQQETIVSTMNMEDVMTVVGTGGGKSLTYMLPAVLSSKPTVVVSPIKSLIDDILSRCQTLNILACKLTGDVSKELYDDQLMKISEFKIILVTPEILKDGELIDTILSLAEKSQLERIVFDEAHTIVSWGSTFRPVYKQVCERIARVKSCPKLLLSATVPAKVEKAIKDTFVNLTVYRSSVFRENLHLSIRERTNTFYDDVQRFVADHKEEFGIIYCVLPKDVSVIHAELLKRGVSCVKYHGQLSEEVKMASYSKWVNGECKLIVANSSFGMGIDKKDVRFVIHARIPTSIDEYYQQCGRAGCDGLPAKCFLYYKYTDKNMLLKLFYSQDDVNSQMTCVNELINFLEDPVQCRHKCLMLYFGEPRENFVCGVGCDNCVNKGAFYLTDGTSDALKVVQTVVELTGRTLTCNTLKLVLSGSRQKIVQEQELQDLSNFGVLQNRFAPVLLLEKFLHSLIYHGILAEVPQKKGRSVFLQLVLGPKAHDLLALKKDVTRYDKK